MGAGASPRDGHPYWIEEGAGGTPPVVREQTAYHQRSALRPNLGESALGRLREAVPYLSPSFACSNDDAELLLAYVTPAGHGKSTDALEDKISQLECDVKQLTSRLQRRTEETSRLKDDVAEARQKQRAIESQSKQTASVHGQRREETRKQLLAEES